MTDERKGQPFQGSTHLHFQTLCFQKKGGSEGRLQQKKEYIPTITVNNLMRGERSSYVSSSEASGSRILAGKGGTSLRAQQTNEKKTEVKDREGGKLSTRRI